jgi:hypothetical protein
MKTFVTAMLTNVALGALFIPAAAHAGDILPLQCTAPDAETFTMNLDFTQQRASFASGSDTRGTLMTDATQTLSPMRVTRQTVSIRMNDLLVTRVGRNYQFGLNGETITCAPTGQIESDDSLPPSQEATDAARARLDAEERVRRAKAVEAGAKQDRADAEAAQAAAEKALAEAKAAKARAQAARDATAKAQEQIKAYDRDIAEAEAAKDEAAKAKADEEAKAAQVKADRDAADQMKADAIRIAEKAKADADAAAQAKVDAEQATAAAKAEAERIRQEETAKVKAQEEQAKAEAEQAKADAERMRQEEAAKVKAQEEQAKADAEREKAAAEAAEKEAAAKKAAHDRMIAQFQSAIDHTVTMSITCTRDQLKRLSSYIPGSCNEADLYLSKLTQYCHPLTTNPNRQKNEWACTTDDGPEVLVPSQDTIQAVCREAYGDPATAERIRNGSLDTWSLSANRIGYGIYVKNCREFGAATKHSDDLGLLDKPVKH